MQPCSQCGGNTQWVDFTSKKGNQVQGWKCQDSNCNNLDFAKSKGKQSQSQGGAQQVSGTQALANKLDEIHETLKRIEQNTQTDSPAPPSDDSHISNSLPDATDF